MSAITIALRLVAEDTTGAAFSSLGSNLGNTSMLARLLGDDLGNTGDALQNILGVTAGAGAAFLLFKDGLTMASDAAGQLEMATTMATIAISDGTTHVNEIEDAIVNMANNSVFKIADVDLAFRVLGERGFDTQQILDGLGETSIQLGEAMGVQAVDGATLLGQAWYLFQGQGISVTKMADELTNAFYNNMNSVSSLTQFLGMAGGAAVALKMPLADLLTFGDLLTPMFGSASSAGASLAYMMRNLAAPATSKVADEIKSLKLQVFDAQGHFVGLKNVLDQLFTKMQGMTDAQKMDVLGTLFNVRSGRAAMDLMSMTQQQFDQMFTDVQNKINQNGTTVKDANAITSTWQGTLQRLSTTWNDFFAKTGSFNLALKPLLDTINHLLSDMQQNPAVTKFFAAFLIIGTVAAGVTLLAVAFAVLGPVIAIAIAVFGTIVGVATSLAGLWTILTTRTELFSGQLSGLNPWVNVIRGAFGALGTVWEVQILPTLRQFTPLWDSLKVILLIVAGLIVGTVVAAILVLAAVITTVVLAITGLLKFLGWLNEKATEVGASIRSFFQGLPAQAEKWGSDLIQSLINGILSKLGPLKGAVQNIANAIGNFLHHSTPDEGPLAGDDRWGGEMVMGFASSMVGALPAASAASASVAAALRGNLTTPSAGVSSLGGGGFSFAGQGNSGGGTGTVIIPINLDSREIGRATLDLVRNQLQMNGMSRQFGR